MPKPFNPFKTLRQNAAKKAAKDGAEMAKAKEANKTKAEKRKADKEKAYNAWIASLADTNKYKKMEYDRFAYQIFIIETELTEDPFGNLCWRKTGEPFS